MTHPSYPSVKLAPVGRIAVFLLILFGTTIAAVAQPTRRPDISVTADRVFVADAAVDLSDGFGASAELFQYVGRTPFGINAIASALALQVAGLTSLNSLGVATGVGVRTPIVRTDRFLVLSSLSAGGGVYFAGLGNTLLQPDGTPYPYQTGVGGLARASASLAVSIGSRLALEVGGDYGWYGGLAHTLRFRIGLMSSLEEWGMPVGVAAASAEELYPSLANSYAMEAPISVTLFNRSRFPARDLIISARSEGLIAGTAESAHVDAIPPGGTATVSLRFPMTVDAAMNAADRTVLIEVGAATQIARRQLPDAAIGSVETTLMGRNALTWTDDRKAAAFVLPASDTVLTLARQIASTARSAGSAIDPMMRYAIGALEAMHALGIEYAVDPNLPAFVASQADTRIVDFLQYPEDTLRYLSGDCDDLSILYASLLEAAGVPAAFITVPGHLLTAFRLSATPEEAASLFLRDDEYIVSDGQVWIPVETTIPGEGFVTAWKSGADQWNRAIRSGDAELIPMADAWRLYPPGLPQSAGERRVIDTDRLTALMERELLRFVQSEFGPQIDELESRIAAGQRSARAYTNLGLLYAQAGLLGAAEESFRAAVEIDRHPSAVVNLAHALRLTGQFAEALEWYRVAESLRPANTALWLSMSLTLRELGRNEESEQYFARYRERRPSEAIAYSSLGREGPSGGRASLAAIDATVVLWEPIGVDE